MAEIYLYAGAKQSCVIVTNAEEQCLYSINNSLIALQHPTSSRILAKIGSLKPSPQQLTDLLGDLVSNGSAYLLSSHGNCKLDSSELRTIQGFESTSVAKKQDANSLEDMVYQLFLCCPDSRDYQFGFRDSRKTKLLFSPGTKIVSAEEYICSARIDKKKKALNTRVYEALLANLGERASARKEPGRFRGSTGLLSRSAGFVRDELKAATLRYETNEIVKSYLGANYSFFNTILFKDTLGDIEKSQQSRALAKHHSRPLITKDNIQEILDSEFLKEKSLIIKGSCLDELVELLQRETGCLARKLRYSPFALLTGEVKELDRLYSLYLNKSFRLFSRPLQNLACNISLYINKGVYLPELIAEFVQHNRRSSRAGMAESQMWNLDNIGVFDAQGITCGSGSKVGIIDTGVDYSHKELAGLFGTDKGWDFVLDNNDPKDYQGHGTHVAGIAAGTQVGIATECSLYSLRVLNEKGAGKLSNILEAVSWAIKNNLDVINLSLGSKMPSEIEYLTFQRAKQSGMLIAAAAGNDPFGPDYPAAYDCVMAVAAVDRDNHHADFSNIQETNNISAPGVDIYSSVPHNRYALLSGTSMATPHLSGVASLAKSLNPKLNQDSFIALMEKTAQCLGNNEPDNWSIYGAGLLRADRLVKDLENGRQAILHHRLQKR